MGATVGSGKSIVQDGEVNASVSGSMDVNIDYSQVQNQFRDSSGATNYAPGTGKMWIILSACCYQNGGSGGQISLGTTSNPDYSILADYDNSNGVPYNFSGIAVARNSNSDVVRIAYAGHFSYIEVDE
jgi:hypothetical protein